MLALNEQHPCALQQAPYEQSAPSLSVQALIPVESGYGESLTRAKDQVFLQPRFLYCPQDTVILLTFLCFVIVMTEKVTRSPLL